MVPLKAVVTTQLRDRARIWSRASTTFRRSKSRRMRRPATAPAKLSTHGGNRGADDCPADYGIAWSGQAFEEKKAGGSSASVFVFGLIMVFLILAAQYEKWSLPLGVLLAVPFALFGALLAIFMRGLEQ